MTYCIFPVLISYFIIFVFNNFKKSLFFYLSFADKITIMIEWYFTRFIHTLTLSNQKL